MDTQEINRVRAICNQAEDWIEEIKKTEIRILTIREAIEQIIEHGKNTLKNTKIEVTWSTQSHYTVMLKGMSLEEFVHIKDMLASRLTNLNKKLANLKVNL